MKADAPDTRSGIILSTDFTGYKIQSDRAQAEKKKTHPNVGVVVHTHFL